MLLAKHVVGYGVSTPKYKIEGMNWVLRNGEDSLDKYPDEKFKNAYKRDKPHLFRNLHYLERFLESSPNFAIGFIVRPKTVELCYGFEREPNYTFKTFFSSYLRGPQDPFKRFCEILEDKQGTLSLKFLNKLSSFKINDPESNASKIISLLRNNPRDFSLLLNYSQNLVVSLDQISES